LNVEVFDIFKVDIVVMAGQVGPEAACHRLLVSKTSDRWSASSTIFAFFFAMLLLGILQAGDTKGAILAPGFSLLETVTG